MARFRRKDLKRDRFVEEVSDRVEFVASHRKHFIAGGVALVVALVGGVGYWTYARQRGLESQSALLKATTLYSGVVSQEAIPGVETFSSEQERVEEVTRALDRVTLDYTGTSAATGAMYYSGLLDREQGNSVEARAHFEQAMRGEGDEYPALARMALGGLLLSEGDAEAARAHFQAVVESPTRTVLKDRAMIEVARTLVDSDPQQARDILSAIQQENGPASSLAGDLMEMLGNGS